jgi:Tfp pilus assembly protein PilO
MNLSRREQGLALVVLGVLVILLADRYVLTPLLARQELVATQRGQVLAETGHAQGLMRECRQSAPKWNSMLSNGLKQDPAEAEGQLLHALRDWAKEAGFVLASVKPDRPESKEQLKEIQIQATGNGSMESVAKFLWKMQSTPFPLKVLEFQLGSRTDGANDLALQVRISTLYWAPEQKGAKTAKPGGGGTR